MNPKIKVVGAILLAVAIGIACIGVYPSLKHYRLPSSTKVQTHPLQRLFLDDGSCEAFASSNNTWVGVRLSSSEGIVVKSVLIYAKRNERASGNQVRPLKGCIFDETGAPFGCFKIAAKRIGESGRWVIRRLNRSERFVVKGNFTIAVDPAGVYSIGVDRSTSSDSGFCMKGKMLRRINGTVMMRVYGFRLSK